MTDATRITVAQLLRPQGRKGELLAELLTDFPERFTGRAVQVGDVGYTVESYWLPVGKNAGRVVLKLAGVESINDAEKLAGQDVTVAPEERAPLGEDEAYISDLVGCTVFDGERAVGVVEDVETGIAGDLPATLSVRGEDGGEHLIPYVKAYVQEIDLEGKALRMKLPEGLVGLNE